ncbi:unnamed protein product [Symbiodinium sp. CCMP2592]|nr:unnamed protein product [Symbiodinium sp. CCMP2592]
MAPKRTLCWDDLSPLKRPRVAGGFEKLPEPLLGSILDFLAPIAHKDDDRVAQYNRMRERMYGHLAYNHEVMPLARDAVALLGSCRVLRSSPHFARIVVSLKMLHNSFVSLCGEVLALECRCPQYELRALKITVERMPPAQGRRHALEQSLLRPEVKASRSKRRCNHHVAHFAGLNRITDEPVRGEMDQVMDEGKFKLLWV